MGVDGFKSLRVCCCKTVCRTAWSAENNRHIEIPTRHGQHLSGVIDDLVEGDEGKIPCHELDDRAEADHGSPDADSGKSGFSDWRVNDALGSIFCEQTLAHFVRAIILGNFFAHQE